MSKETFNPTRFNLSSNTPFDTILERHLNRRKLIRSGGAMAALSMISSFGLSGCGDDDKSSGVDNPNNPENPNTPIQLGFDSIAGSKTDAVAIPSGYKASVLAPWGAPLNNIASAWRNDGTNTSTDQLNSVGMHHDGMRYFPINGSSEDGLLCINHEYVDENALHPNGPTIDEITGLRTSAEEVRKEIYAHGVTVVRIRKTAGAWEIVLNDPHNKRFTGATEMAVSGPLAGSDHLVTKFAPNGMTARGTLNNCGNGYTPWGTYLTCEENWPDYFANRGTLTADQIRIGVPDDTTRYGWDEVAGDATESNDEFVRFNCTPTAENALLDYRNEANGHGYIVEIDPFNPGAMAVKRTGLGRFRHEGCEPGIASAGKPIVFYSGHDARFEYIYKFVSDALWDPADANSADKLAIGAKYMDVGTLYVAKFNEDGTGNWLPLTPAGISATGSIEAANFTTLEDIILNTARAADLLGATPMDRPEWAAVDPLTGSVYMTLTNNTRRNETTGINAANPRLNNRWGHIIRWDEGAFVGDFTWDIFVFGAPAIGAESENLSGLTDLNQFASPDGLIFDERGILWVQTDNGAAELTDVTNDQMLAIVPSTLAGQTITSNNQVNLKRMFVGPNGCEVTGLANTPDYATFFTNIQHPGNWPFSADAAAETPAGMTIRPRAATVIIEKIDGGLVGE